MQLIAHQRLLQTVKTVVVEEPNADVVEIFLELEKKFKTAMDDDFNTREALTVLFEMAKEINRTKQDDMAAASALASQLKALAAILGLLQQAPSEFLRGEAEEGGLSDAQIDQLVAQRQQAKVDKDFALADKVRDQLKAAGVVLEDSHSGTRWRRGL